MNKKRAMALAIGRSAGYHDDTRAWVRALVENPVSRSAMNAAWMSGVRAKASGIKCDCFFCKRENGHA